MTPGIPEELNKVINHLHEFGARCLLAGGGVIDHVIGVPITDWDIEVYNISYSVLSELLTNFGSPNLVGKSFGVIKIHIGKLNCDFSIPRKDNRIGKGHKAFTIDLLPDLTPAEAARRRDITINSMYLDLHTMEYIDPFNGLEHLKEGRIKATDPETFIEDPLRVLRIMQLLPRKGKFVDPATIELCQSMLDDFDTLAKERIYEEFKKLLLKAKNPSAGLRFLDDCHWLTKFPGLYNLKDCPQNPLYHPEGSVWDHTMLVIDQAARQMVHLPEDWRLPYMLGMLCHDMGKPATTNRETFTAYGHENVGVGIAKQFLEQMTDEYDAITKATQIVAMHMRPFSLYTSKAAIGAWRRLHNHVPLQILAYVTKADAQGRSNEPDGIAVPEFDVCLTYAREFGEDKIRPVLMGRHLIERGHKPGSDFTAMLDRAFQYQLDTGCEDIEQLYAVAANKTAN